MIPLVALAAAADPALEGVAIPPGVEVRIERTPTRWTVRVDDRSTEVPAPADPEALAAFRALVASLVADLAPTPPEAGAAASLALALVGPPPARPPPAPAAPPPPPPPVAYAPRRAIDDPRGERKGRPIGVAPPPPPPLVDLDTPDPPPPAPPRWTVAVGPELVVRPGVGPSPGLAGALTRGRGRSAVGVDVALRAPRPVAGAPEARLVEAAVAVDGRLRPVPAVELAAGAGAAWRRWWLGDTAVATHVMPVAIAGATLPVALGPASLAIGAVAEVDLVPTDLVRGGDPARLVPVALRAEIRVRIEPDARSPTSVR